VLEAALAAHETLVPGVSASVVDAAARTVLRAHGLADCFTHSTGHGVGFSAIDGHARPRLHPASEETIQPGMTFNIEPAVYIEGVGGVRHCDMLVMSDTGPQLLTRFHSGPDELVLKG
jgi:Xaa-Pro aminopeptidase